MAAHKRKGPTTCLSVLGIVIDTVAGELRLPADKLECLRALLQHWGSRTSCSHKELESLIGLLNHTCKVVRSGRSFLRRMLDLLHALPPTQSTVRLNTSFRSDLAWRTAFIAHWKGTSFLPPLSRLPNTVVTIDASGSWGCSAWQAHRWFQLQWDSQSAPLSIEVKELIPIILACATWGHSWHGQQVLCQFDNQLHACARGQARTKTLCTS